MSTALIDSPSEAAELLRDGGLVAFPTETVFGLGVDATNDNAVRRLFAAKGRPSSNPLIVHLPDASRWADAAAALTTDAEKLLAEFSPGPLTVVLPKRPEISMLVTAGLETVGIRAPQHPVAREILQLVGKPIAAPSANRSGRPSGTTWRSVLEDLDGKIDAVLGADASSIGLESTVVDCTGEVATVLRPGSVTIDQIRRVVPHARELGSAEQVRESTSTRVRSPGTAHPHYRPIAEVRLVDSPESVKISEEENAAYCGLLPLEKRGSLSQIAVYDSLEEYATAFYEFLREADRHGVKTVYAQLAPDHGIGHALRDRQLRAAGEKSPTR